MNGQNRGQLSQAKGKLLRGRLPWLSRPPSSMDRPPLGVVLLVCLHEILAQDRPPTHGLTETLGAGLPRSEKRNKAVRVCVQQNSLCTELVTCTVNTGVALWTCGREDRGLSCRTRDLC